MKDALIRHLFDAYPRIFANDRDGIAGLPPERRIACGDGWYPLLDALCEALQWDTDHDGAPQIVVVQVKHKLGSMRVAAFGPRTARQDGMMRMAALLSTRIPQEAAA